MSIKNSKNAPLEVGILGGAFFQYFFKKQNAVMAKHRIFAPQN